MFLGRLFQNLFGFFRAGERRRKLKQDLKNTLTAERARAAQQGGQGYWLERDLQATAQPKPPERKDGQR